MSHPSLFDVDDDVNATVELLMEDAITAGVGNCRLLQTTCLPTMGAGVEREFPEPAVLRLGVETVGLTNEPVCDIELLASIVGVFVTCHELEPFGMRAYD